MATHYALCGLGGILIGLSSAAFLVLNGRIAGVSGILGGLVGDALRGVSKHRGANLLFVAGLMLGPFVFHLLSGSWPALRIEGSVPLLAGAGLLVGFGTRLGSGCTSGHGVSGLARLSVRSFVAVGTFLLAGIVTVLIMKGWR